MLVEFTESQQHLVEVIGQAFRTTHGTWPIFDYVEGTLDSDDSGIDAWATLQSLPRIARHSYSAVFFESRGSVRPRADSRVGLTIVGVARCDSLRKFFADNRRDPLDFMGLFLEVIGLFMYKRRGEPPDPLTPRELRITSTEIRTQLEGGKYALGDLPERFLYDLLDREPPFRGQAELNKDGSLEPFDPA